MQVMLSNYLIKLDSYAQFCEPKSRQLVIVTLSYISAFEISQYGALQYCLSVTFFQYLIFLFNIVFKISLCNLIYYIFEIIVSDTESGNNYVSFGDEMQETVTSSMFPKRLFVPHEYWFIIFKILYYCEPLLIVYSNGNFTADNFTIYYVTI